MKKLAIIISAVAAVALLASLAIPQAGYQRGGSNKPPAILVISNNAPGYMKVGGPGRYLCDGTEDNIQLQEAINDAQASGVPEVQLVGGFTLAAPIYVGYNGGLVEQNAGCSLVSVGGSSLTWAGSTATDCSTFMVNIAPSVTREPFRVQGLKLFCNDAVNGLFTNNIAGGTVQNIHIGQSRYIALLANDSWFSHYKNITIWEAGGVGALFLRCNGATIDQVLLSDTDEDTMPEIRSYYCTAYTDNGDTPKSFSSTLEPLETIVVDPLGSPEHEAIFLGYMAEPNTNRNERIVVAYTDEASPDLIDTTDVWEGAISEDKMTVGIDASNQMYDLNSGICITSSHFSLRDCHLEDLDYDDDPIILVIAHGGLIDGIRTEFTSSVPDGPADTIIHLNECYGVSVENIQGFVDVVPQAYDCDVTDAGASGTVATTIPTYFGKYLDAGDEVFMWDGDGGITDGVYTVTSDPTDPWTTFAVDEDPGSNSAPNGVWIYAITQVDRLCPDILVEMEECWGCSVRNVSHRGIKDSFVTIDALCIGCSVDTVRDSSVEYSGLSNDWWLTDNRPTAPVVNSGAQTKISNLQVYHSGVPGGIKGDSTATYGGLNDAVQELTETDGTTYKTTLNLHRLSLAVTELAGDPDGEFSELIYTFPEGRIVVTGVVVDVTVSAVSDYDADGDIGDTAEGDFSLGTTADADQDLTSPATDLNLCPSTSVVLVAGVDAVTSALAAPTAHLDGTASAIECHLNGLWDAASVAGNTDMGIYGTVIITWKFLGDY